MMHSTTSAKPSLFRPEVSVAQRGDWLGSIILLRPLSFAFLTTFALISAGVLLAFLFFANYTKRTQVTGLLVPDSGLIKIQAPQPGIVLERRVKEGQSVQTGEVLYVISSELNLANTISGAPGARDSNAAILDTLRARQQSLDDERQQQRSISLRQTVQLEQSVRGLQAELQQLDKEILTQTARLQSAQNQYQRHQQLAKQSYISDLALQQKQDEVLDQQARLQTAQRSKMSLDRDLNNAQTELDTLAGKSKREQTQLKRQSLELEQASVSTQTKHQFVIIAPQAGIVTAIQVDPGQMVTNQTLLTILPAHAQLEAQLYVPSRAAGFIKVGQQVQIRYAAYPYQKFGQYQGKVQEVSRTALSAAELPAQLGTATTSGNSEGMYRVRVLLGQQAITAYGKPQKLNAGMQLEADILQDRRTLIEWVLEPIYSLFGKVV